MPFIDELLRSRGKVASFLDALPIGICTCNASGEVIYYNRHAAQLWGREPDISTGEVRWCGALNAYLPNGEYISGEQSPMAELLRSRIPVFERELEYQRPDGSRVTIIASLQPRFDDGGEFLGGVNCFQDITERKRIEEREKQTRNFLQSVFETSPDCIKVVSRDGALLQINPSGCDMLEAEREDDLVGKSVLDVIRPEFREEWAANHARVCAGERIAWEFDISGLNGTIRHMSTNAVPIELPDGGTAHLAVTRDATKRKNNERAIRENEHRLRQLLSALPAAIYTTDAEGRIDYFNDAAVDFAGWKPQIGAPLNASWKLLTPDGVPLAADESPMAITLKTGQPVRGQIAVAERPDGSRLWLMPYPTPLRNSNGEMVGAVNMMVDVTEIRRAEQEQRLLIDELNHRVKNTLASVQSFINLTSRGATGIAEYRQALEGRVLAMSRAHDQLSRRNWSQVSLCDVAEAGLGPFLYKANIVVEGEPVEVGPRAAVMLSMAFHELATNAAKYGALSVENGAISLAWTTEWENGEKKLRLAWRETGGPEVAAVERKGFGTQLLQRGIATELGGRATCDFARDGLRCEIEVPLQNGN